MEANSSLLSSSIIIPFYNDLDKFLVSLNSNLDIFSKNDQVIIVDDNSCLSLEESLKKTAFYDRISLFDFTIIRHITNLGPSEARNTGAKAAKHNLLFFIDSDVVINSELYNFTKEFLVKYSNYSAVTAKAQLNITSQNFASDYKSIYMDFYFSKLSNDAHFLYGSFCAIKKKDFKGWNPSLRFGEDSELGVRMSRIGYKIYLIKDKGFSHLKSYTLVSLVRNDFLIAHNFMTIFLSHKKFGSLFSKGYFSHVRKSQKYSLICNFFFLILLPLYPIISILFLFVWLILNSPFFSYIYKLKGFKFLSLSILWSSLDHLVMFAGIVSSLFIWPIFNKNIIQEI